MLFHFLFVLKFLVLTSSPRLPTRRVAAWTVKGRRKANRQITAKAAQRVLDLFIRVMLDLSFL